MTAGLEKRLRESAEPFRDGDDAWSSLNAALVWEAADALAKARAALEGAQDAMNVWTCTFADDMVGEADAAQASEIVLASGGTIAYITRISASIGAALEAMK